MKAKLVLVCLFSAILFGPGFSQLAAQEMPIQEQRVLHESYKLMEKNKTAKALQKLRKFAADWKQEKSVSFYLLLGNCYYELKDPAKAKNAYSQGVKIAPENFNLRLNHALACYSLKDYSQAGQGFKKAHELKEKKDFDLLYRAAFCFYQAGSPKQCASSLQDLFQEVDKPKESWLQLYVHTCIELGWPKKAKAKLRELIKRNPESPKWWELLAKLDLQLKNYIQAATSLEAVYSLRIPEKKELENLVDLYEYVNVPLQAAATMERIRNRFSLKEKEEIRLSRLYSKGLRHKRAVQSLNKALKQEASSELYLQKGRICYSAGWYERAIGSLKKCLELDQENSEAMLLIAYSAWQQREWTRAREYFAKAEKFEESKDRAEQGLEAVDFILQAKNSVSSPLGES